MTGKNKVTTNQTRYTSIQSRITNNQNRTRRFSIILGIVSLASFIIGFIIDPSHLRNLWLIISGTLTMFSGIAIYLIGNRIILFDEDYFNTNK